MDTNLFRELVNDDWAGERVTLTFSKFELQAVANALSEVVDVITRDAVYVRHPVMHEVTRAKAAFRAVIGRTLLPPIGTGQLYTAAKPSLQGVPRPSEGSAVSGAEGLTRPSTHQDRARRQRHVGA